MKAKFGLLFAALMWMVASTAQADIMTVNVSGVAPQYRSAFLNAERFWESRLVGFSPDLPSLVRRQLSKIQIVATTAAIDGVGGILGQAAPTRTFSYSQPSIKGTVGRRITIAQEGFMEFDIADLADLAAQGQLENVIRHEMAHVLGFGSLWAQNDLLAPNGQYAGRYALNAYRTESGNRGAPFVPVEQQGGPGTAGSHWDSQDSFFVDLQRNRSDLMIGFLEPNPNSTGIFETKFVSETTWAAFADLWFAVKGVNARDFVDAIGTPGTRWPKWTFGSNPGGPIFMVGGPSAIPEPSAGLVLLGCSGLLIWRRRR